MIVGTHYFAEEKQRSSIQYHGGSFGINSSLKIHSCWIVIACSQKKRKTSRDKEN